jgi:CRP/FNR family cyclic AMP-dependent transcriptional regulator
MPCDPSVFEDIPIFSLLDADERAVLAEQVDLRRFTPRQRIFRAGDPGDKAYVLLKGRVQVVLIDDDNQEVVIDAPGAGEIFGLASMLSASPHRTSAVALEETSAIEVTREDLAGLLQRKPMAGLDMLTMAGRQFHAAQDLVRTRAARNPNEVIAEQLTLGDRIADHVARFGGSWSFIIAFGVVLVVWVAVNVVLAMRAWDPYPFILLNLVLSCLAAMQGAILLIAAKRADQISSELAAHDYEVNRKAEKLIEENTELTRAIKELTEAIHARVIEAS